MSYLAAWPIEGKERRVLGLCMWFTM